MEQTFTSIYENFVWGNNNIDGYNGSSGGGSSVSFNKDTYIPFLKKFILQNNNIKKVVDLGCGDFRCGELIYNDLDINYLGYDAYQKVVDYNNKRYIDSDKYSFKHLDFFNYKEELESADMCILKDVIQHWKTEHIYSFLDYLVSSKKFKYIVIVNCCHQTKDDDDIYENGGWRGLSCDFFPLKKYNPQKLYNYQSKEVSIIFG